MGTADWLNWNCDLDNPNDTEDDCAADNNSNIVHNNFIEDPECPQQKDMSTVPNLPGLVRLIQKSKRQAENIVMTINVSETQRNKGRKKK